MCATVVGPLNTAGTVVTCGSQPSATQPFAAQTKSGRYLSIELAAVDAELKPVDSQLAVAEVSIVARGA